MELISYANNTVTYNTYAKLEDFTLFKEYYPFDFVEFDKLDDRTKEMYFRLGSEKLDKSYNWKYSKLSFTQNLEHPRLIASIDRDIVFASIIVALDLFDTYFNSVDVDQDGIKSEQVGRTLRVEYKNFKDRNIVDQNKMSLMDGFLNSLLEPYIVTGIYLCRG